MRLDLLSDLDHHAILGPDFDPMPHPKPCALRIPVLVLAFCVPCLAFTAITDDTTSSGIDENSGTSSFSFNHVMGVGYAPMLFVGTGQRNDAAERAVTQIASEGVTAIKIAHQDRGGFGQFSRCELWYMPNPPTGTIAVTIFWNGNVAFKSAGAASWFGVNQATPLGALAQNGGCGGTSPLTVAVTETDSIVVDVIHMQDGTRTSDAGQTLLWSAVHTGDARAAYSSEEETASQSAVTVLWSTTGNCWSHIAQELLAAPDPTDTPTPTPTSTWSPTATWTPTATSTWTPTHSPTSTETPTSTITSTSTFTRTMTPPTVLNAVLTNSTSSPVTLEIDVDAESTLMVIALQSVENLTDVEVTDNGSPVSLFASKFVLNVENRAYLVGFPDAGLHTIIASYSGGGASTLENFGALTFDRSEPVVTNYKTIGGVSGGVTVSFSVVKSDSTILDLLATDKANYPVQGPQQYLQWQGAASETITCANASTNEDGNAGPRTVSMDWAVDSAGAGADIILEIELDRFQPSPTSTHTGTKSHTPTASPSRTATPTKTRSPTPTATPSPTPLPLYYLKNDSPFYSNGYISFHDESPVKRPIVNYVVGLYKSGNRQNLLMKKWYDVSPTSTKTSTWTSTHSLTATPLLTYTITPTDTASPTVTDTGTMTSTPTESATFTGTHTSTITPTASATFTPESW